ncbi:MAG: hypothetical protein ACYTBY_11965 [Planctomycetota bacterium]|jgi:hypothetical protein
MIAPRYQPKQVLIDIDTQRDMLVANGAASVYNHRNILANIHRVMAAARHHPTGSWRQQGITTFPPFQPLRFMIPIITVRAIAWRAPGV